MSVFGLCREVMSYFWCLECFTLQFEPPVHVKYFKVAQIHLKTFLKSITVAANFYLFIYNCFA